MSVLVTGGAGYIGSHAVKALRAPGTTWSSTTTCARGTGRRPAHRRRRAARRGRHPRRGAAARGDARARRRRGDAFRRAALGRRLGQGSDRLLRQQRRRRAYRSARRWSQSGVTHFIFSSTAATFGNPIETPITEIHPQRPINAYGETKLAIERALPHFERAYGLRSIVLRYFNAAGADQDGTLGEDHAPEIHVIPRAIDAALGRDSFAIFGDDYETPDGTCLRDYVHVMDLASAHLLALRVAERGGPSAAYNLGNGRPISVREVVDSVERVTGKWVPVGVRPAAAGRPRRALYLE